MNRPRIIAVAIAVVSLWTILAAGAVAVWLTGEPRIFGVVMLPAGVVASLLVVYFEWRTKQASATRVDPAEAWDRAA